MENYGFKYIHKLTQFVETLNSRENCSKSMIPFFGKSSDFFSILYSKLPRKYGKPEFKIGDRVRVLKYDLTLRKG